MRYLRIVKLVAILFEGPPERLEQDLDLPVSGAQDQVRQARDVRAICRNFSCLDPMKLLAKMTKETMHLLNLSYFYGVF